jgi:hypothetical protein
MAPFFTSGRSQAAGLHFVYHQTMSVEIADKHRYYSLADERVAGTLESLMVLAGTRSKPFVPNTPTHLRWARTCYGHMAGEIAVALHDRLLKNKWIAKTSRDDGAYELTAFGARELTAQGVDVPSMPSGRRRIACACLDWSERRPYVGVFETAIPNYADSQRHGEPIATGFFESKRQQLGHRPSHSGPVDQGFLGVSVLARRVLARTARQRSPRQLPRVTAPTPRQAVCLVRCSAYG